MPNESTRARIENGIQKALWHDPRHQLGAYRTEDTIAVVWLADDGQSEVLLSSGQTLEEAIDSIADEHVPEDGRLVVHMIADTDGCCRHLSDCGCPR